MSVVAMNRCVCEFLTDPQKECTCTPLQIQRYRSRVSGPLLDRIDTQIEVPALRYQDLASKDASESSDTIRQRVNAARAIQHQRFQKTIKHKEDHATWGDSRHARQGVRLSQSIVNFQQLDLSPFSLPWLFMKLPESISDV